MAIPVTNIHANRLLVQVETTLMNVQRGMVDAAKTWKAQTQGATQIPLALLQANISAAATTYLGNLQWVIDARADAVKHPLLVAAIAKRQYDETADLVNWVQSLRQIALGIQAADISSYAAISAMCDQLSAATTAPPSIYPE